jgi:hypothetical protein
MGDTSKVLDLPVTGVGSMLLSVRIEAAACRLPISITLRTRHSSKRIGRSVLSVCADALELEWYADGSFALWTRRAGHLTASFPVTSGQAKTLANFAGIELPPPVVA